jgi:hypothetical protein
VSVLLSRFAEMHISTSHQAVRHCPGANIHLRLNVPDVALVVSAVVSHIVSIVFRESSAGDDALQTDVLTTAFLCTYLRSLKYAYSGRV